jgi:hypothetical protein
MEGGERRREERDGGRRETEGGEGWKGRREMEREEHGWERGRAASFAKKQITERKKTTHVMDAAARRGRDGACVVERGVGWGRPPPAAAAAQWQRERKE